MKTVSALTFDRVAFDQSTDAHLVVTLDAPSIDWQAKRQRLCVIPCIDISGSMSGDKLHYAKQAAMKLVDQLSPGDYAGLVTFSDDARTDFFPCVMNSDNRDRLRSAISKIHIEGGTNFSGGMIEALAVAKRMDLPVTVLTRVIMLTDGQPTIGIAKDQASLCTLLEKTRAHVSLSAFGFGRDPDQALLSALSAKGDGNYAFIDNPDQALAAFGKELGGLLSSYAQSISVEVVPSNGHFLKDLISDLDATKEITGEWTVKVPSLLAEETMNLVFSATLSPQKSAGPRQVNTFAVKVTYERLGEDGSLVREQVESKAKVQFVKADEAQKTPNKELDTIVARAQLVQTQIEAEKAAKKGDYAKATSVFQQALDSQKSRGLVELNQMTHTVMGLYSNPGVYLDTTGRRTALRNATSRGAGTSALGAEDASLLATTGYIVSNSAQDAMSSVFEGSVLNVETSAPPVPAPIPVLLVPPVVPEGKVTKSRSKKW